MICERGIRKTKMKKMKVVKKKRKKTTREEKGHLDEFNKLLNSMRPHKTSYHLTRIVLVRFMGFIYFVAFLVAYNQNLGLLGKNGLLPANKYMEKISKNFKPKIYFNNTLINELRNKFELYKNIPTLFWFLNWSEDIDFLLNTTSLIGKKN